MPYLEAAVDVAVTIYIYGLDETIHYLVNKKRRSQLLVSVDLWDPRCDAVGE